MMITTQVQDAARGVPAARIPVELDFFITGQGWKEVGHGLTNVEGRISEFGEPGAPGIYRLTYDIASYIPDAFFPSIAVTFDVRDVTEVYHVPLVLSPFGYSTCRMAGQ
jgi:5-hydroxyisourate hydrolase